LINRTFGLVQNAVLLTSYAALLFRFSPLAVAVLVLTGLPAFVAEAKFSGEAFRLFRWRSPERRQQIYLETVISREDYAKEVKIFQLAPRLLDRYRSIFERLYREDRRLVLRRGLWAYILGIVSTAGFYGAYVWLAFAAVRGRISVGEMTMYLLVFKEGQSAVSASLTAVGGMYEDNLYLSTLYEYLEQPTQPGRGNVSVGTDPADGVRFENVTFRYPGSATLAIDDVSFHVRPGEKIALVGENGSGKTTLIKLLTRLYAPDSGRILLDGVDLQSWSVDALRARIGVIFQDFVRYQLTVGENIGAGDVRHFEDEARWTQAADKGLSSEFIEHLPERYRTQLGKWFRNGQELSGGQWQKIALSRAFARTDADILVLDEPTSAIDAEAEATLFDHFRQTARGQMAILISHRFSTVRQADRIAVLAGGRITEIGSHDELLAQGGTYARLFLIQAQGYR
jgi:ATP-binding cassette, subfamily B, bacterial